MASLADGWESRWVSSKSKTDYGAFKVSAGKFYGDAEAGKGTPKEVPAIDRYDCDVIRTLLADVGFLA